MGVHQVLVTGVPDAQAHPRIVRADMGRDGADAVVPRCPTAIFHPQLARLQIQFIINDDNPVRLQVQETHGLAHRLAGFVHERQGLEGHNFFRAKYPFGNFTLELVAPAGKIMAADNFVHRHEADIVPVSRILSSRIAETNNEKHVLRLLQQGTYKQGRRLFLLRRRSRRSRCTLGRSCRRSRTLGRSSSTLGTCGRSCSSTCNRGLLVGGWNIS